jgi:hypothetical protein
MQFRVLTGPDGGQAIPNAHATVLDQLGAEMAPVAIEGFSAESVPAGGWYVEEIVTALEAPGA